MGDLSKLATSPKHESEGVWTDYVLDIRLRIARKPNTQYDEFRLARMRAVAAQQQSGLIDKEAVAAEVARIDVEATGRFVLIGWEHIQLDGADLPYSPDASVKLLSDPALHDLAEFVETFSSRASNYRRWRLEEALGNSPGPSPGG